MAGRAGCRRPIALISKTAAGAEQPGNQTNETMTTTIRRNQGPDRRLARAAADAPFLSRLCARMNGRLARPDRSHTAKLLARMGHRMRRDPRYVARRWLRRFAGGAWHLGGSHVARLHFGPGIAFVGFCAESFRPIKAALIRAGKEGV